MASSVNSSLQVPYEIGLFIASQVPRLDQNHGDGPWAEHAEHFGDGPNPFYDQMEQGFFLVVDNSTNQPLSICTRYGQWTVLASSSGSFHNIFQIVKEALKLNEVEKQGKNSYYAIQHWNSTNLDEPVRAKKFVSWDEAKAAFEAFKPLMSEKYTAITKKV